MEYRGGLYDAQESNDDAEGANVGSGQIERRVFGVVGDAADMVCTVLTFEDPFNELPLAAVDDIDVASLEE